MVKLRLFHPWVTNGNAPGESMVGVDEIPFRKTYFQRANWVVFRCVAKWWSWGFFRSTSFHFYGLAGEWPAPWWWTTRWAPLIPVFFELIHWHPSLTQIEPERCECISYCQRDFINIGVLVARWIHWASLFDNSLDLAGFVSFFSSGMSPWVEESHKKGPWRTFHDQFFSCKLEGNMKSKSRLFLDSCFFFLMFSFLMIYLWFPFMFFLDIDSVDVNVQRTNLRTCVYPASVG